MACSLRCVRRMGLPAVVIENRQAVSRFRPTRQEAARWSSFDDFFDPGRGFEFLSRCGHVLVRHHVDRPPVLLQLRADAGLRRAVADGARSEALRKVTLAGAVVVPLGRAAHVRSSASSIVGVQRRSARTRRLLRRRQQGADASSPGILVRRHDVRSTCGASSGPTRRSSSARPRRWPPAARPTPTPPAPAKKAARASRANTFFSITMLWFMVFTRHFSPLYGYPTIGSTIDLLGLRAGRSWAFVEAQRPRLHRRARQPVQQAGVRRPPERRSSPASSCWAVIYFIGWELILLAKPASRPPPRGAAALGVAAVDDERGLHAAARGGRRRRSRRCTSPGSSSTVPLVGVARAVAFELEVVLVLDDERVRDAVRRCRARTSTSPAGPCRRSAVELERVVGLHHGRRRRGAAAVVGLRRRRRRRRRRRAAGARPPRQRPGKGVACGRRYGAGHRSNGGEYHRGTRSPTRGPAAHGRQLARILEPGLPRRPPSATDRGGPGHAGRVPGGRDRAVVPAPARAGPPRHRRRRARPPARRRRPGRPRRRSSSSCPRSSPTAPARPGIGRLPQQHGARRVDAELDGPRSTRSSPTADLDALPEVDDDELDALRDAPRASSSTRSRRAAATLFDRIDALQAELTRRYRTGEASVESLLQ